MASSLSGVDRAVVPGFYGSSLKDPSGVQTFTRGGSDVTGAIVAAGCTEHRLSPPRMLGLFSFFGIAHEAHHPRLLEPKS